LHQAKSSSSSSSSQQQQQQQRHYLETGNESVPNIIINNTLNLFFETAMSILLISNHNIFRVLIDKNTSAYFI